MLDELEFRGDSGLECEEFIRSIRKRAFQQGRFHDGIWMTAYASTCFTGPALRWYEQQPADVQSDWGRLTRALLEQYPAVEPTSIPEAISTLIPTPAAAPHPQNYSRNMASSSPTAFPGRRTGRIKIIGETNFTLGYVGHSQFTNEWTNLACIQDEPAARHRILHFSVAVTKKLQSIHVDGHEDRKLAIFWPDPLQEGDAATPLAGLARLFSTETLYLKAPETVIWELQGDNIAPQSRTGYSIEEETTAYISVLKPQMLLFIPSSMKPSSRTNIRRLYRVRLEFESLLIPGQPQDEYLRIGLEP